MRGSVLKRAGGWSIVYDAEPRWDSEKESWRRNQKWEKIRDPDTKAHAEKVLAEMASQEAGPSGNQDSPHPSLLIARRP